MFSPLSSLSLFLLVAMIFYPSAIDASDEAVNAVLGNIIELLFFVSQASGDGSRRLVVVPWYLESFLLT